MIRRPPRSTLDRSSAASDVYKRQQNPFGRGDGINRCFRITDGVDVLEELCRLEVGRIVVLSARIPGDTEEVIWVCQERIVPRVFLCGIKMPERLGIVGPIRLWCSPLGDPHRSSSEPYKKDARPSHCSTHVHVRPT